MGLCTHYFFLSSKTGTSASILGNAVAVALDADRLSPLSQPQSTDPAADPFCRASAAATNVALIGDAFDHYVARRVYRRMRQLPQQRDLISVNSAPLISSLFLPLT